MNELSTAVIIIKVNIFCGNSCDNILIFVMNHNVIEIHESMFIPHLVFIGKHGDNQNILKITVAANTNLQIKA